MEFNFSKIFKIFLHELNKLIRKIIVDKKGPTLEDISDEESVEGTCVCVCVCVCVYKTFYKNIIFIGQYWDKENNGIE